MYSIDESAARRLSFKLKDLTSDEVSECLLPLLQINLKGKLTGRNLDQIKNKEDFVTWVNAAETNNVQGNDFMKVLRHNAAFDQISEWRINGVPFECLNPHRDTFDVEILSPKKVSATEALDHTEELRKMKMHLNNKTNQLAIKEKKILSLEATISKLQHELQQQQRAQSQNTSSEVKQESLPLQVARSSSIMSDVSHVSSSVSNPSQPVNPSPPLTQTQTLNNTSNNNNNSNTSNNNSNNNGVSSNHGSQVISHDNLNKNSRPNQSNNNQLNNNLSNTPQKTSSSHTSAHTSTYSNIKIPTPKMNFSRSAEGIEVQLDSGDQDVGLDHGSQLSEYELVLDSTSSSSDSEESMSSLILKEIMKIDKQTETETIKEKALLTGAVDKISGSTKNINSNSTKNINSNSTTSAVSQPSISNTATAAAPKQQHVSEFLRADTPISVNSPLFTNHNTAAAKASSLTSVSGAASGLGNNTSNAAQQQQQSNVTVTTINPVPSAKVKRNNNGSVISTNKGGSSSSSISNNSDVVYLSTSPAKHSITNIKPSTVSAASTTTPSESATSVAKQSKSAVSGISVDKSTSGDQDTTTASRANSLENVVSAHKFNITSSKSSTTSTTNSSNIMNTASPIEIRTQSSDSATSTSSVKFTAAVRTATKLTSGPITPFSEDIDILNRSTSLLQRHLPSRNDMDDFVSDEELSKFGADFGGDFDENWYDDDGTSRKRDRTPEKKSHKKKQKWTPSKDSSDSERDSDGESGAGKRKHSQSKIGKRSRLEDFVGTAAAGTNRSKSSATAASGSPTVKTPGSSKKVTAASSSSTEILELVTRELQKIGKNAPQNLQLQAIRTVTMHYESTRPLLIQQKVMQRLAHIILHNTNDSKLLHASMVLLNNIFGSSKDVTELIGVLSDSFVNKIIAHLNNTVGDVAIVEQAVYYLQNLIVTKPEWKIDIGVVRKVFKSIVKALVQWPTNVGLCYISMATLFSYCPFERPDLLLRVVDSNTLSSILTALSNLFVRVGVKDKNQGKREEAIQYGCTLLNNITDKLDKEEYVGELILKSKLCADVLTLLRTSTMDAETTALLATTLNVIILFAETPSEIESILASDPVPVLLKLIPNGWSKNEDTVAIQLNMTSAVCETLLVIATWTKDDPDLLDTLLDSDVHTQLIDFIKRSGGDIKYAAPYNFALRAVSKLIQHSDGRNDHIWIDRNIVSLFCHACESFLDCEEFQFPVDNEGNDEDESEVIGGGGITCETILWIISSFNRLATGSKKKLFCANNLEFRDIMRSLSNCELLSVKESAKRPVEVYSL